MDEPQGEQLINCPFCEEDPREPAHYAVGRHMLVKGSRVFVQLSLTCLNALPGEKCDNWLPFTFLLNEAIMPMGPLRGHETLAKDDLVDWPPGVTLTEDDEAWARGLQKRFEDVPQDGGERGA